MPVMHWLTETINDFYLVLYNSVFAHMSISHYIYQLLKIKQKS